MIAVATATIWASEKRSKHPYKMPWGLLWITSFIIYIYVPTIIDSLAKVSLFGDIEHIHNQVLTTKFLTAGALCFGFSLGYYVISQIQIKTPRESKNNQGSGQHTVGGKNYLGISIRLASTLGVLSLSALFAAHLPDTFDRYNSGATAEPIARIIQSLNLAGLSVYSFFYGIGVLASLSSWWDVPVKFGTLRTRVIRWRSDAYYYLIVAETLGVLLLLLKTGSRSMIVASGLSFLIGLISTTPLNKTKVLKLTTAFIVIIVLLPGTFETIRIARSNSDFYRSNPSHMFRLIKVSATFRPSLSSIAIKNRREEFNEIALLKADLCIQTIAKHGKSLAKHQIMRLQACQLGVIDEYKSSNPLIANGYLRRVFSLPLLDTLSLSKQDRAIDLSKVLARSEQSTSKGEKINLAGDLFLRGGYIYTIIGGYLLGTSYAIVSIANCWAIHFIKNSVSRVLIFCLPLGLMSGALLLTIDGQVWLLLTQYPKSILTAAVAGTIFSSGPRILALARRLQRT